MTRVIFCALLALVGYVFAQYDDPYMNPDDVAMDMKAVVIPDDNSDKTVKGPSPRQFLLGGGYGGYGVGGYGLGYGSYGGYGGYGLGYGGLGLGYGGLSSGLCTRTCLGIGCRMICRNRVLLDEDPEDAQDTMVDLTEDEMNDLLSSDDTDASDDRMVASTAGDFLSKIPEKTHRSGSCGKHHGHSSTERNHVEILESSRPTNIPSSSKWTREKHYREITENARPEESSNTGLDRFRQYQIDGQKVIVVPHEIYKRLHPNDILVRKKFITNPDGSKTWTKFHTVEQTSQYGSSNENVDPSVTENNKVLESTVDNNASSENNNVAWEKHHHSKEESSRGNFFNPSSTLVGFTSQENREDVLPSSLQENSQTENEFSTQEELRQEQKIQQYLREKRIRKEMRRRKLLQMLESQNQQVDNNWNSGSSRREGLETSTLQSNQLPTENTGEVMLTKEEFRKFMKMMKREHHKNRPVIIIMDEDQDQQQQPTNDEDQDQ